MAIDWGKVQNVAGDVATAIDAVYGDPAPAPVVQETIVVEPEYPEWLPWAAVAAVLVLVIVIVAR